MTDQTIGEAVWNGDYWGPNGAIARAQQEYEAAQREYGPRGDTHRIGRADYQRMQKLNESELRFMNALYSAFGSVNAAARRGNPAALVRAVRLIFRLRPFYQEYGGFALGTTILNADQQEMLSAQLVKFAAIPLLGGKKYRVAARTYAGEAVSKANPPHPHTPLLARLTLARIGLAEGNKDIAISQLRVVEGRIGTVSDPNQKARILRSCAELRKHLGEKLPALRLIHRAKDVPDVSPDAWAKVIGVENWILATI